MTKVKAIFELEMEDEDYQFILNRVETLGYCVLASFHGIVIRKPDSRI